MAVVFEAPKVATSVGELGTVAGVQLVAVFQSPVVGLALQVALPANDWAAIKHEKAQMTGKSFFILRSQQKAAGISRQSATGSNLRHHRQRQVIPIAA